MSNPAESRFRPHRWMRSLAGPLFGAACLLATFSGVVVLVVLLASILLAAIQGKPDNPWYAIGPNLRELWGLLSALIVNRQSSNPALAGFRIGIVGSLWLLGLVALIGIPVGIAAGVYLEEYAPPGRLRRVVQTNIANLAGVPSIVYGILGLALFVRGMGFRPLALGSCLLAGALTLGLLILPIIVITTQEAIRTVPVSLRQAALALGATRWQMVSGHVLPAALPGILTGTILGLSRAIGETAPLLMVGAAGALRRLPTGPLDRYSALPVEIYNYAKEPGREFQTVAAGGIVILVVLLLSMNGIAILIRDRFRRYQ
ncbi:Phosphate transport system permease protein PstA [Aquisphaera giovannonii]|uniref:Phosphate transport system permease protein PstA n=1 Tax=Aquisphaera giovannonii TaxID=406548 RepID=A0A5B9W868_9BACT|nr:phosphate ABC transporter permease PstA [Aquisphaera giovannonii]QEH36886.1 Phosphate transport system permease protein PstA [Aquisphaera giovannonii]